MKLLIGGSPCTHWSIAQTKDRETKPEGVGWELFLNFLIALKKYQPNYFLYENNKSMSTAIRAEITRRFGFEPALINSALVSAQNRQRLYWVGRRNPDGTYSRVDVAQPKDRGILLRYILESGVCWREKAYTLDANYWKTNGGGGFDTQSGRRKMVAEPVQIGKPLTEREMEYMVRTTKSGRNHFDFEHHHDATKDKSSCVTGNTHKGVPYNVLVEPVLIGAIESNVKAYPVYEVKDGQITIKGKQYPVRLADGYYIIRKLTVTECERLQTVPDGYTRWGGIKWSDEVAKKYKKAIEKGKARLNMTTQQFLVRMSDTQAYKMLGNGWTVDVIAHIMSHFPGITTEPVEVLSMYDGMSCGHIALDKLGANVTRYYATEIDKYAIQTTLANYPDTVQLGDAFRVREEGWVPCQT